MTKIDRRSGATPEDLVEFGDGDTAGDPSIAALIAILPEPDRARYREARREALARIDPTARSWREYLERKAL